VTLPPPRPVDELIDSLPSLDGNTRHKVVAELLAHGRAAVPGFLRALADPDVEIRFLAIGGLAHLADPSTADTFAGLLGDPDERIRAEAANGLDRIGDPRALDALVQTFDDWPDPMQPTTLAAEAFIKRGVPALPHIGPLLSSPEPMTRARAYSVLQTVVSKLRGVDWPSLWRAQGSYDPLSTDDGARERAAESWRAWIAAHAGAAP
jgi:HEAT repeat protein